MASNRADDMAHALSDRMSNQLQRMHADGAQGIRPFDYEGLGQYGADLDSFIGSNGWYRGLGKMASLGAVTPDFSAMARFGFAFARTLFGRG